MAKQKVFFVDNSINEDDLKKADENGGWYSDNPLVKSLVENLRSSQKAQAIAFDVDPASSARYSGLYIDKSGTPLLPDTMIKRMFLVDDLLGTINRLRSNHGSTFGHLLQDRHSTGYRLDPKKNSKFDKLPQEKKLDLLNRAHKIEKSLFTCGNQEGLAPKQKQTFPEFLYTSASNSVRFGRITTEKLRDSNNKFCGFRAIDPSTVFFAKSFAHGAQSLREHAVKLIEEISGQKNIDIKKFEDDQYAFIQVIEGAPRFAFTEDEMVMFNFFPTTDVESNHYPITPLDTIVNAVVTHINISNHNKLYFQNGRAARGMIVVQSDTISDSTVEQFKQGFQATINSVSNAWRVPVVKIQQNDKMVWQPLDTAGRDMEFQYLNDENIRTILAAYAMSPDEVPGYGHLSKGTNSQSLSEGNNEFKLEAARDVGIRPMLSGLEAFMNSSIIPEFDKEVSEYFCLKFYGLEAETPEKETGRIEKEQQLWGTINDTLRSVEKEEIPKYLGGDFPLALAYGAVLDKYLSVGQILEYFMGVKDASKDPRYDYLRDNFYFQHLQIIQAEKQSQDQKKMAEEQAQQMQQSEAQQGQSQDQSQGEQPKEDTQSASQLEAGIEGAMKALSKNSLNNSRLLGKQDDIRKKVKTTWDKEIEVLMAQIKQQVGKKH